jgi:hypothetical protein
MALTFPSLLLRAVLMEQLGGLQQEPNRQPEQQGEATSASARLEQQEGEVGMDGENPQKWLW